MKTIPSLQDCLKEVQSNIYASTKGQLEPASDPAIAGLCYAFAQMKTALYSDVYDSINQLFARTATEESFLSAIAFDRTNNFIQRKAAEFATGQIWVTSDEEVDVPVGSQFIATDGNVYESTIFRSTYSQVLTVSALERIDGVAYATINSHNLGNLMTLTFAGANETDFNGDQEITIVDENTISFDNAGDDEEATGTITATFFGVKLDLKSVLPNESANKTYSNSLEIGFTTDLTAAYITYDGITGGADIESLISFSARIENWLRYPQNAGRHSQHTSWVQQNSDSNYTYFYNSEDDYYLYLTAIVSKMSDDYYFTNFTTDELAAMKAKFIDNNQFIFAGVSALQLSFVNFTQVTIGITINGLSPTSTSMKTAIKDRLRAYIALLPISFYLKAAQLSSDKISSVISGARDEAGNVPSFTSVTVSGATFTSDSQKPILGTVLYA